MKKTDKQSPEVFVTNDALETQELGTKFARILLARGLQGVSLSESNVIALYGDLGSGKTTFVQGLAKGLGINKRIISPTFIILRTYNLRDKNYDLKFKNFYHADLYRINNEKDIEGLGFDEIIKNKRNVAVIEWAEKMKNLFPKERIDIYFEYLDENKRKITIRNIYE